MIPEVHTLIERFDRLGYVVEEDLATVFLLMQKLGKPLLLEGPAGVGKTEAAHIIASHLDVELIRLQCYEGLDVYTSMYEWNYQKQLLSIKIREDSDLSSEEKEDHIFSEAYLLKRPLLKSITATEKSPVLLIDEIDRADEEFEAFLLEVLSDFQISIPELGTIKASYRPVVVLTSNRTRELSDALKRRCLYHWIPYPSYEKELKILRKRCPDINEKIAIGLVKFIQHLRGQKLQKSPGVTESLDWANGLLALQVESFSPEVIDRTLGCVLKSEADLQKIRQQPISEILQTIGV
jgi:MoxR-like ATPase